MATLISHWKASVSSGSTFVDVVNGFNMTLQGSASFNSNYNGRPALVCSANGDYAELNPTNATLRPTLTISLAGTFYVADIANSDLGKILAVDDWRPSPSGRYYGAAVQVRSDGRLWVSYGDGGDGESDDRRTAELTSGTISQGQWYTVLCVIRGATDFTIYLNSVSASFSTSGSGNALTYLAGPAQIGGGASGAIPQQLIGGISETWFYDGEATPSDLVTTSSVYNSRRYIPNTRLRIRP